LLLSSKPHWRRSKPGPVNWWRHKFNDRVASTRGELQHDIVLDGAKANEIVFRAEQANRHPSQRSHFS
jgi:hypothetical protein